MFANACELYSSCYCQLYEGVKPEKATYCGSACLLSRSHTVTAYHVYTERDEGNSLFVASGDGYYESAVLFNDENADLAVLKLGRKIGSIKGSPCMSFPAISEAQLAIGARAIASR